ncbi:Hypothetical protein R9X50_00325400 [Acrodontium crateriforme]|uniref:PSP1 C-terminal domain-containing protein n=1 Tax=Acrodontium crateriforme TaxID=150365 RepID=A0AAQ3R438_9PEZI|nr:Hypothetical protein R9X50_00325400 [Acrodontium crateriforme]
MNPARRATPDSEAVASSEDERPWPSSTSFGSLPRKEGSVPGLPGGIWSTQRRGSYKLSDAPPRNVARDSRLGISTHAQSALRAESTPSPAASEGTGTLPFSFPLQPTSKTVRSLSHSQGQREAPQSSGNGSNGPDHVLPLGLLTEEADADTESDFGTTLTHTMSHPPPGSLHRTSTFPLAYEHTHGYNNGHDVDHPLSPDSKGENRLENAFANLAFDQPPRRAAQWQSHLGWDDLPNQNESRRHSLADIPTRRGSLVGASPLGNGDLLGNGFGRSRFDEDQLRSFGFTNEPTTNRGLGTRPNDQDSQNNMVRYNEAGPGEAFNIPATYKVPYVDIAESERPADEKNREIDNRRDSIGMRLYPSGAVRPRKVLIIVSFKCSRVDVFYLLENTGLVLKCGDIVIVEADRGQDLGTVQHVNVTPDQARIYKRKYAEEQYKWLMMFSENNSGTNVNPNAMLLANAPATMQGLPRDNYNNLKPKAIKRLASQHEIRMLAEKEGNEAKAKRTCQQKVAHLHLQMEILDAEWQWDFQKLIFYYYADHYINFKDLITDLYRIYKTRIWLSAVNPASFSQHAIGQPPSGIGPGAITNYGPESNTSYTMRYGQDPDPYGAVPPYRIGYDTYTPNYPSIPGVQNSFAPQPFTPTANNFVPSDSVPTVGPGTSSTGSINDYHHFYDRSGRNDQISSVGAYPQRDTMESPTLRQPGWQNYNPSGGQQYGNAPGMGLMNNQPPSSMQWSSPAERSAQGNASSFGARHGQLPQSQLPLPIGSRSYSISDGSGFPQSSVGKPGDGEAERRVQSPEESLASKRMSGLGLSSPPTFGSFAVQNFGNGNNMGPSDMPNPQSPTTHVLPRKTAASKQTQVNNYLQNLPESTYADDMSRER